MRFNYDELTFVLSHQLNSFFGFDISRSLPRYLNDAIQMTNKAFFASANKYCGDDMLFSPFHSEQYCIFLYFLSRVMWMEDGNGKNAEKIFYLNKILNSVDLFYEVDLPAVWGCSHPLGSIMGRGVYGNGFYFFQGCTVGVSNGRHPRLGSNVIMYANSKVLGNCTLGDNVIVASDTTIIDMDIPSNSIVFGKGSDVVIKESSSVEVHAKMTHIWKAPAILAGDFA